MRKVVFGAIVIVASALAVSEVRAQSTVIVGPPSVVAYSAAEIPAPPAVSTPLLAPAPVVTYSVPAPVVTYGVPAPVITYRVPSVVAYPPTIYGPVVTGYPAVVVRPKVYVPGQPIRNFFRAITP